MKSPPDDRHKKAQEALAKAQEWSAKGAVGFALENYQEAFALYDELGQLEVAANIAEKIGDLQLIRGNLDKALLAYKYVLEVCEDQGDAIGAVIISEKIIDILRQKKDYGRLMPYYLRCLELAEQFGDAHKAARYLVGIGDLYSRQKRFPEALEAYRLAKKIYKGLGSLEQLRIVEEGIRRLEEIAASTD